MKKQVTKDKVLKEIHTLLQDASGALGDLKDTTSEIKSWSKDVRKAEAHLSTKAVALAQAVDAFAEWQRTGYTTSSPKAHEAISKQLWWEVAEHVQDIIGREPSYPHLGEQESAV